MTSFIFQLVYPRNSACYMDTMKQVDDGEEKSRESESMEEKVVDEVTVSKEIHAPVPVEHTTVEVSTYISYYE